MVYTIRVGLLVNPNGSCVGRCPSGTPGQDSTIRATAPEHGVSPTRAGRVRHRGFGGSGDVRCGTTRPGAASCVCCSVLVGVREVRRAFAPVARPGWNAPEEPTSRAPESCTPLIAQTLVFGDAVRCHKKNDPPFRFFSRESSRHRLPLIAKGYWSSWAASSFGALVVCVASRRGLTPLRLLSSSELWRQERAGLKSPLKGVGETRLRIFVVATPKTVAGASLHDVVQRAPSELPLSGF